MRGEELISRLISEVPFTDKVVSAAKADKKTKVLCLTGVRRKRTSYKFSEVSSFLIVVYSRLTETAIIIISVTG